MSCPGGGIGRRCGLKIRCPKGRAGSSPALGTIRAHPPDGCLPSVLHGQIQDVVVRISPDLKLNCGDRFAIIVRRNELAVD